ncbi:transcription factor IIA subunit alpha [Blastocladiella emersonii ATCC 22665]|nr:transcription factor IIA subunit alpha [Blastocladiella emersonii ATCC 22665]
MSNNIIPNLYREVIQKVIEKAREEFELENIDDAILDELKITWERKLKDTGVADFGTADDDDDEYYAEPYAAQPPPPAAPAQPAAPTGPPLYQFGPTMGQFGRATSQQPLATPAPQARPPPGGSSHIPQYDGPGDDDDDEDDEDDDEDHHHGHAMRPNEASAAAGATPAPEEYDEDAINSDLDDENDDSDDEADSEAVNMMLCQYEKVNRTKNKWKCVLRDGIVQVNGLDYAFSRITGDYQF